VSCKKTWISSTDEIQVFLQDTSNGGSMELVTQNITITGGEGMAGKVTFENAPAWPWDFVVIKRTTPVTQLLNLNYNEGLTPQLLEDALDKLTRMIQELQAGQKLLKFTLDAETDAEFPPFTTDDNPRVFVLDADGKPQYMSLVDLKVLLAATPDGA
jgi:hypothetical protein